MAENTERSLFNHGRKSLASADIVTTNDESLICPLCWQETPYCDLSLEHIVPKSLGGNCVTLTCRRCNNEQGSELDSHLSGFQRTRDAFKGYGKLPTTLNINDKQMVANLDWGETSKNFVVVGKASNPIEVTAIRDEFAAGKVSEITFTFPYGYPENRFQTAVLRSAYLVLFKCFGYEYARHEIVQTLRRRICEYQTHSLDLSPFIAELCNGNFPFDEPHFVLLQTVGGIDCFLVVIRVKRATATLLAVYMPRMMVSIDAFSEILVSLKRDNNGKQIKLSLNGAFT